METNGGPLKFHKRQGSPKVVKRLAASQEYLATCSSLAQLVVSTLEGRKLRAVNENEQQVATLCARNSVE